MKYTLDDFARLIDHTNLHADASNEDMKKLCDEAKKYHFKMENTTLTLEQLIQRLMKLIIPKQLLANHLNSEPMTDQ